MHGVDIVGSSRYARARHNDIYGYFPSSTQKNTTLNGGRTEIGDN